MNCSTVFSGDLFDSLIFGNERLFVAFRKLRFQAIYGVSPLWSGGAADGVLVAEEAHLVESF